MLLHIDVNGGLLPTGSSSPDYIDQSLLLRNLTKRGLGKAIVLFALSRFLVVEPDADFIFLHTHTWAYKAVGMYQKMGFRITKKALPTSRTDFSCMDVLKDVLPNSIIAQLLEKD